MPLWLILITPAYAVEVPPDFISGYGSGGIIGYARSVAVDSNGNVYVADANKSRIAKFNSNGDFIKMWGHPGSGQGEFGGLMGYIAIDSRNIIYLADNTNHRIQKFDVEGNFIGQIATRDTTGELSPFGIAISSNGTIYISDQVYNLIAKFSSAGIYLGKWGSSGSANGQFQNPGGLRVDAAGYVYVADDYNHRVQKFDANGVYQTKWGTEGTANGQFTYLGDLTIDSAGFIYVADYLNDRIQKFSNTGIFQATWGRSGSALGQLSRPIGIAATNSGYVYVVDGNARVNKFTLAGAPVKYFAGINDYTKNGTLNFPHDIAVDSSGNMYVSDTDNHRVQKFNANGQFVSNWGQYGEGLGDFWYPLGLAIDTNNNIYVADSYNHRIQKFTNTGVFIASYGEYGSNNGQFKYPEDVALDNVGNIYVVDTDNNRIQKLNSNGVYITKWGSSGSNNSQFSLARQVALDIYNNVYVVEEGNHRVQKFTSSGSFLAKWGIHGDRDGQLFWPYGMALDRRNNVFLGDYYSGIQKFTNLGSFLMRWSDSGYNDGYTTTIRGMVLDNKGTLYVTDRGTGVQLFTYPPTLSATIASTSINLVWNDPSYQETGFRVERCTGATCTNFVVVSSPAANVLSFNNAGLAPSTTYLYRIRAVYGSKLSSYSSILTTTTRAEPVAPNSLVAQVLSGTQVRLTWRDASIDETNFSLERCAGVRCTSFAVIASPAANTTTYTNTDLSSGITYRYRIRMYRDPDYSSYSNIVDITPFDMNAPTELSAAAISSTQVQLDWVDNSLDETNFRVERCAGATCTNFVGVATVPADEATTLQTGLVAGTTYRYRVRAYRAPNFSAYSNIVQVTPQLPNALTSVQTKVLSSTQVRLTWALTNLDESEARIERCAGAGCTNFAQIGVVSAYTAVYINGSLTPNTLYRYRIRAYRNGEYSAYSSIVEAIPKLPVVPTNLRATVSAGQAKLSWVDNSRDETNFRVERCTGVGCTNFAQIATTAANKATYTQAGLVAGTTYRYRVRAYRLPEYSAYSNIIDVRP
ncbi:MAG: 6-bladed beta-propeller [Thiofilum sp.]|uniref:fibronectin type III domain-containing protein n=1 Tax=Thiofilum sp. TaxID=2212733 RepID=UPI0025F185FA|nr:6-bladed beta-propeller [Thiofilum sp.]MBK8452865.1 6-bladed beta-propeller [Thiofilum sp.]